MMLSFAELPPDVRAPSCAEYELHPIQACPDVQVTCQTGCVHAKQLNPRCTGMREGGDTLETQIMVAFWAASMQGSSRRVTV